MPGNKFAPPFDPTPMIIVARHGNMITAESRERKVTRNVSFFKRSPPSQSHLPVNMHNRDHHIAKQQEPPTTFPLSGRSRKPPSSLLERLCDIN